MKIWLAKLFLCGETYPHGWRPADLWSGWGGGTGQNPAGFGSNPTAQRVETAHLLLMPSLAPLPIDEHLPRLLSALSEARCAVLVAPPGTGKTTRVAPAILAAKLLDREHPNLVMLQPRRVAARAAAQRIADEQLWQLGQQVGYQIRFERVMTQSTRLRVVTEGILTRQLLDDPFLETVGAVLLDEFHERSIHTDMALAMLRELRQTLREDLIVLVMSATLLAEPVAKFLGHCPIIHAPGRAFEVQIEHRPHTSRQIYLEDRVSDEVRALAALSAEQTGDILVFLPGTGEIRASQERLSSLKDRVLPLYGSLPFEQQILALAPHRQRKIILATNIAETSLTIPGVRTVIDSGLAREAAYDSVRGMDQLQLSRISKASAAQRAGRAGRTAPGRCIRLYTAKEYAQLADFDVPEIRRVDLAGTVLALHVWGKTDFSWFEAPPPTALAQANELLSMLGAQVDGKVTDLGKRMLQLPVHPRLSRLLLAAADQGLSESGAALAALLSEKDIWTGENTAAVDGQSDLLMRLDYLERPSNAASDPVALRAVRRLQEQLLRMAGSKTRKRPADLRALLKLILLAYPDRVAMRRKTDPNTAIMVGGGGLRLARQSVVRSARLFVAIDVRRDDKAQRNEALVRLASAIEPEWLEECFPGSVVREPSVYFDEARGRVAGRTQIMYRDLVLGEELDAAVDREVAAQVLAGAVRSRASQIFAGDPQSASLLARIEFLRKWMPEHPWPAFDDAMLADAIAEACAGKRSLDELTHQPLAPFLHARLEYPLDRLVDQHAPQTIQIPSGKRIAVTYQSGRPPTLSARLQELFGWASTPRLAGGRASLVLEILGPNFRPVQVTGDLGSFWKNTYPQVRKDLRRRYPKHSWPEDPTTAKPQSKGGR